VTGFDVPYPYWQLEDEYLPSVGRITHSVRRLLEF
jgi:pyruvate/2-oxoglutarate/acetoin dehydrogenase E1 component